MASDRIHTKIIKEGNDVTLPRVMEIARLEVSTQRHIDRMQETAKVNYIQYGKGSKKGKQNPVEKAQQVVVVVVAAVENPPVPVERVRKFHYPQTFVGDVVKEDIRKGNPVRQWKPSVGTVPYKDITRKCV